MDIFRNLSQSAKEALYNSITAASTDQQTDTFTDQQTFSGGLVVGSGGNTLSTVLMSGATLSPNPVGPNTAVEQTFSVPNLVLTDAILVNKPSGQTGLALGGVRVSGASTLAIHFVNTSAATLSPNVEYYRYVAFR